MLYIADPTRKLPWFAIRQSAETITKSQYLHHA